MKEFKPGPNDLVVPFIFVPHGSPDPVEWMAQHPGWFRIPARFVPRADGTPDMQVDLNQALDQIAAAEFDEEMAEAGGR